MNYKKLASEGICVTIFCFESSDKSLKFRAYFKDFINNYLYNPFVNGTYPVYDSYPEAEKAMSLAIKKYKKSKLK
jgi:hypothetical protein